MYERRHLTSRSNPTSRPFTARLARFIWLPLALLVGMLLCPPVAADVLILKNGNRLEGRVEELGSGQYRITIDEGNVVTLRRDDVAKRVSGEAPIDELRRRLNAIAKEDRRALIELAAWAEVKGLRKSALAVYRLILKIDPHHEGARQQLGFVLHKNRWVRRSELKGQGLVRFRGSWHTPVEVDRIRVGEAVSEFLTLLGDVHHENKFIRENARLQLIKVNDDRLIPTLIAKLSDKSPVERLMCGDVLSNFGFAAGAAPLYRAWLNESVPACIDGFTALLGRYGRGEVGLWVARDLGRAVAGGRVGARGDGATGDGATGDGAARPVDEVDAHHLGRLLGFVENFPHRSAIDPMIDVMETQREWSRRIDRTLSRLLGLNSRSADQWRTSWSDMRDRVSVDLGTGWVGRAARPRR